MTPTLSDVERTWLEQVREDLKRSEDHLRPWRQLCNENYRQYRTVATARAALRHSRPPDRDLIANEMVDQFGSDIHVPIAYSTIETLLPRTVQNRPRGLVLPEERLAEENVENMRMLVYRQQDLFRAELMAQDTVKSGFLYGLGVQFGPFWKREIQRGMPYYAPAMDAKVAQSRYVVSTRDRVLYDDAWGEDVDVFDFAWDPYGYDSFTLRWAARRTWRDSDYIAGMLGLSPGAEVPDRSLAIWNTAAAQQFKPDEIKGIAVGQAKMDGVWKDRMQVSGHSDFQIGQGLHEVWEYWTRKGDLVTVLDGEYPVRITKNPFWHGQLPFHFYRPQTAGIKQLHGISEIEPMGDLIRELDVMRSQRRDNAAITLQRVFAFDEDAISRDDLVYGPGVGIPVRSDDPRAHLFPIDQPDIPFSSYREEQALKEDLDRTSGVSDTVTGAEGGGAAQTATGAQLLVNAANLRIENKTRRYEAETAKPFTDQQIVLNQQMIVEKQIRVPTNPQPGEIDPKPWQWIMLTPGELAGLMSYDVEGGAVAPKNPVQDAQLGQNLFNTLRDNPAIDQTQLVRHFLESQGIKQANSWVMPQPSLPPQVLDALQRHFNLPPDQVQQLVQAVTGGRQ